MTPRKIFTEFENGFSRRKFTAGLLVSFIDFLVELDVPGRGFKSYIDLVAAFPKQELTASGARANTLIVMRPSGKTLSLRRFYNEIERYYRAEHKRFDYPSAAPHATQAWGDYLGWFDSLVTFTPKQLSWLRGEVNTFVLTTLTNQEFDPSLIELDPPWFKLLIEGFEMRGPGEPSGASFQGIVFGFLRADNAHLQVEIDKVRTGSKRLQRVGDVDCWEGSRLAISAEIKQYTLGLEDVTDLHGFANATGRRGALGIVAALGFDPDARRAVEALGAIALELRDMLKIVELWDPLKQRTAVSSFIYYANHIEKNAALTRRINSFMTYVTDEWRKARPNASLDD